MRKTREQLIKYVKAAGQGVIDKAEDLVGEDYDFLTDFYILLRFPFDAAPEIEVTRNHYMRNAMTVMMEE